MKLLKYMLPCFCFFLTFAVVGCHKKAKQSNKQGAAAKVDTVVISGMAFHPADLKVSKGDTVVWVNKGLVTHDVTEYPKKKWTSGDIKSGDSWKKVIHKSFNYFCSIHPTMTGKIRVPKTK
jgi:plastocyanin